MKIRSIATPLTIAAFLGLASTGICMLLEIRGGLVNPIHELSSIAFLIGSALHIIVHREAIKRHLKTKIGISLTIIFAVIASASLASVVAPIGEKDGKEVVFHMILEAKISDLAVIAKQNPDEILQRLSAMNLKGVSKDATLLSISKENNESPFEIMEEAFSK